MYLSTKVLGNTTVAALTARAHDAVLTIGKDRFTRADLAGVECFNYIAAANLSAQLKVFRVASTKDVFDKVAPTELALPRLGPVALAVLGAAFERKGLPTLEAWVVKHRDAADKGKEIVTFATMKAHTADGKDARLARQSSSKSRPRQRHMVRRPAATQHAHP